MHHETHPFAKFVAILGRGKTKQRPLTQAESQEAMGMILRGDVLPEQIGAFLMLLRLKEEAPEEIAGFTLAVREVVQVPADLPQVDLDWPSYAGKRVQLPWYILSVLALVNAGHSVFMHGTEGHTPGRVYTRAVLERLGLPVAASMDEAAAQIRACRFTYVPLEVLNPVLHHLINLRPLFGLRSPVHSFTRMVNPFGAETMMLGIFHRGFMDIHAGAARLLDQPRAAVFRGDGGEAERRPNKPLQVWLTEGAAEPVVETWPALLNEAHQPADAEMDIDRLAALWTGALDDAYATASVVGTIAVALRAMNKADSATQADSMARAIWEARDRQSLTEAA